MDRGSPVCQFLGHVDGNEHRVVLNDLAKAREAVSELAQVLNVYSMEPGGGDADRILTQFKEEIDKANKSIDKRHNEGIDGTRSRD